MTSFEISGRRVRRTGSSAPTITAMDHIRLHFELELHLAGEPSTPLGTLHMPTRFTGDEVVFGDQRYQVTYHATGVSKDVVHLVTA
jgi:hypothetical protein